MKHKVKNLISEFPHGPVGSGSDIVTAVAWVAAVARVRSPAQKRPHAYMVSKPLAVPLGSGSWGPGFKQREVSPPASSPGGTTATMCLPSH